MKSWRVAISGWVSLLPFFLLGVGGGTPVRAQIAEDGSCSVEGVVFQGVATWRMNGTVDPSTDRVQLDEFGERTLTDPAFRESANNLQMECEDSRLQMRVTFGDRSGQILYGLPLSAVLATDGKLLRVTFSGSSLSGETEDLRQSEASTTVTLMDCCGPSLNRHQLVNISRFGTDVMLFRLVRVAQPYRQVLFSLAG